MVIRNLTKGVSVTTLSTGVVAGSTNVTTLAGVDMKGYTGVVFLVLLGTLTATQVTKLKAQYSNDDGSTDAYSDIAGSSTAAAADADAGKFLVLDIHKPLKRYVKPVITRATANAVITTVIAIRYSAATAPPASLGDVSQSVLLAGPGLGTA